MGPNYEVIILPHGKFWSISNDHKIEWLEIGSKTSIEVPDLEVYSFLVYFLYRLV